MSVTRVLLQRALFRLGGLDTVSADDAGGPVQVEHQDEVLAFLLQRLDLSLQLPVQQLQTLRLLQTRRRRDRVRA